RSARPTSRESSPRGRSSGASREPAGDRVAPEPVGVVRGVGTPVVGGELCTVPGRHGTGRSTSTVRSARDRAAQEKSTTPSGSTRAARTVTSVSGRKPSPVRWKTVDSPAPVAVIRIAGRSAPRGGGGGGGDAGGTRIVISTNVPFR